ncbi:MAG: acyl-CoA dehydrogenase family protein [Spirochaetota bacterium]|nr:acyl-CoA dehydrogenase family protein [Spirochaetota bacterium]
MDFRFTKEEEEFRQEVRDWLKKEIPKRWHELHPVSTMCTAMWQETEESWPISREFQRKLGSKGWLAPSYPKQYGGSEMSHMKRLILAEELSYNNAPVGVETEIAVNWVGPDILLFGTEEQKEKYVKGVALGEKIICLGYSEPNAGSDLASIQTKAEEDGDEYVINGSKIWTSYAHHADYCWLVARTDPNAPKKYQGVSMFIIDMKTPGITVRPLVNIVNFHSFNEVFFDNVRATKDCLVGEKNKGFYELMIALDYERSSVGTAASLQRILEGLIRYAKEMGRDKDPIIRQKLGEFAIEVEVSRMMCYRIAWMFSKGLHPNYESSMSMIFMSDLARRVADLGRDIQGLYAQLALDSKWTIDNASIERLILGSLSIGVGGGTNEIQRNIIAQRGLGLPRK